uniref:Integral membrane protein 2 n=1 Tax=Sinocyclocheilus rhinocerous TaxID=307959 RepID=A0A673M6I6_9TELE
MVKISFQPITGQKAEKEEGDGDKTQIFIPHPHVSFAFCVPHVICSQIRLQSFCCVFNSAPDQSRFHCRVVYEDSVAAPLRGSQELEESVGIYLKENYEQISIPVPDFSNTDPADIIHDFNRGLTAYHDIALDKCYVIELNTSVVMPPRNLWELLINVKKGTYLPQTYIVQEEMVVTGRVNNMHQLGRFIYRLCNGKDTYRLHRRTSRRRITKRDAQNCHRIRHFENTFVVETMICETP